MIYIYSISIKDNVKCYIFKNKYFLYIFYRYCCVMLFYVFFVYVCKFLWKVKDIFFFFICSIFFLCLILLECM